VSEQRNTIRLRRPTGAPDSQLEDDRTGEHELVCVDCGDAPEWTYRGGGGCPLQAAFRGR
jgi:hypothetical protein